MRTMNKKIVIGYMVLYLFFALFGAQFGLTQMKASAIWIPSGIALAFIVMYKKPMLPIVFITTYISHVLIAITAQEFIPLTLLISAFFGMYVTLGGYFIMRILDVKSIDFLLSPKFKPAVFILMAVTALTLGISFFSTFTLYVFQRVNETTMIPVFFSWWAGDFFGIILATPYVIAIVQRKEERRLTAAKAFEVFVFSLLIVALVGVFMINSIPEYAKSTQFYLFMLLFIWPILRFNALQSAAVLMVLLMSMSMATFRQGLDLSTMTYRLIFQQVFIAVLAVYTWILSKLVQMLQSSKDELGIQNETLTQTNLELRKLMDTMRVFFDLVVSSNKGETTNEVLYASMVLNTAFRLVSHADYGSIMIKDKKGVRFMDAIGYDVVLLNELEINKDQVEFLYDDIIVNTKGEDHVKSNFKKIKETGENTSLPPIKESVYIGIMVTDQVGLTISIDIRQGSSHRISKSDLDNLKVLQAFLNGFYKMRAFNTMQHQLHDDVVSVLVNLLEQHDKYTVGHSEHVAHIAVKIARKLKLSDSEVMKIRTSARIHDIGKLWIPGQILNKKDPLTEEEYKLIKEHPQFGEQMVNSSVHMHDLALIVKHHHERYDGKGYPSGLKDKAIPLASRIIFVADAYDAMTSIRSYRSRIGTLEALEEIKANRNTQFDPEVVAAFVSLFEGGEIA